MDQKKIDRINELSRKSKSVGLTDEEKLEQKALREEYVLSIRQSLRGQLDSIKIQNPDGTIIDVKKRHDDKFKAEE